MAALLGLEKRHFRHPEREPDPAFDAAALVAGCEVVDLFGPMGPGDGPHGRDEALHGRIRAAYRHRHWIARFHELNAAFLAHDARRRIVSPLSGGEATILGSVPLQHQQVVPCLDGDRLILLIGIGHMPVGIFYPAERLFLVLTDYHLEMRNILRTVVAHMMHHALPWAEWMRRALRGGLRRAFLIGDNRPSHFMRQSLAYLDTQEEAILAFARGGGLLVAVPDWCAMDPFAVFPSLSVPDRLTVHSDRLTETVLLSGLDAHRVYRVTIHRDAGWLRQRLAPRVAAAPAKVPGRFRAMISLDAERERVVNAVEAFRHVLGRLGAACAAAGTEMEVVWDGWTVSGPPTPRDREVMARIEAMIGAIREGDHSPLAREVRIFDRSALDKVPELAGCDIAFTTRGTGAMISSWLLCRPTIVYQRPGETASAQYLDPETAVEVDPAAIGEPPPGNPLDVVHKRFTLAPQGLEDAIRRALEGRSELSF